MKIESKRFKNRVELDKYIESGVEEGSVIEGTREDLRRLFLDDRTKVHGIPCIITDTPTEHKEEVRVKPKRGKRTPYGLDGKLQKPPKKKKKVLKTNNKKG